MKVTTVFLVILSGSFFLGCEGLSSQKIIGKYYLVALDDVKSNTSLSYEVGNDEGSFVDVIEPMVFAVGFDSNFIVVKQYPDQDPQMKLKVRVFYYIVPLKERNEYSENKNVYGPFNEKEFNAKKEELRMPKSLARMKAINCNSHYLI